MTRDVVVNGRAAKLVVEGSRFEFLREDAEGGLPPARGFSLAAPGSLAEGKRGLNSALRGAREFSIASAGPAAWSVLLDGRAYRVTRGGPGELVVNGRAVTVEILDPRDRRARQSASTQEGAGHVTASMPGRVVRVLVAPGDTVELGQGLVVVEAMKMQNEMKSPKAGRVAQVRASAGADVTAGQVLVIVE
jgi:biotin carboxyl carrier protein